ncbi:probable E3 ubiquitin-protein ligase ZFP1 isoform X2 [Corylus avellana]|nr:probable E3 ubiquitin-protein ligase ZFP1 isoform X2 [Corylus avellana]XP_059443937.1 probable E3 ubiquitin-protein ligase ZFP1 isoform X2 [Corylus avellana]XP_059443938.1 probable E3 ubiquitin-protein ligase ZFP1 isoform X2 [Corylus avellana]XP_059443939.1 probable E3 ubiquitin-protein ligase ZFP1 isoform X2 [Corylus avellana]
MGQRNMLFTNPMIGFESDQHGQNYLRPEPCILVGSNANFAQPNIRTMVSASGNTANLDVQYAVEPCDNGMIYGMTHYNGIQHHHNIDLGVAPSSNFYYSYMTPSSGSGALPAPRSHGASGQLTSSSHYGVIGVSTDVHGRNSHFMDDVRGPCKRKHAEGIAGCFQHNDASSSSSSSVAPLNTRHPDGVAVMDGASFDLSQYRGVGTPSSMEVGPQNSLRNRAGATVMDSLMVHDHNHLIQANYMGQPFQPAGTLWLDQQLGSNSVDGGTSSWNQAPAMPYVHGSNANGGSMESRSMGVQRYHETASNRSPPNFQHPPPINHQHHNLHHPGPLTHGVRGQNINFQPQVAAASYRVSTNPSRSSLNPVQNSLEMGHRHPGSVPPTGLRIYRHHRGGFMPEATLRHRNLPHLRVLQADETAILDMPEFYQVGNLMDHHRDMRLDIEDMSYEELLALGEQIGSVSTGLSEETVTSQLKTKSYLSSATVINLEEAASVDQEADSCIICQDEYKNQEKIGILDCGHDYHADCLKKWLVLKNVCPICKSEALTTGGKDV